jgi:hypothetical protein
MRRIVRDVKGIAGHLVDLGKMANGSLKNPHSYTKFLTIVRLQKKLKCQVFLEAGTFKGVMADRCSKVFERVITIELDSRLAEDSKKYLSPRKNVMVVDGDASLEIPKVFNLISAPDRMIVYLDGHFSGGETACGDVPEPALIILEKMASSIEKIGAIVIDDFRSFGTEKGCPSKAALIAALEQHYYSKGFDIIIQADQVIAQRTS